MPAGDADRIRNYATRLVEDARRNGETRIKIRSGDIHNALGLSQAHANVGQSLEGEIFQNQAGVRLVDYRGVDSRRGANAYFIYEILPASNRDVRSFITPLDVEQESVAGVSSSTDAEPKDAMDENLRERILELSPSEFQELAREYLKAKGFDDAEIEITIRMKV